MCISGFGGGGKPNVPDAPPVDPAPTREGILSLIRAAIDDEKAPEKALKAAMQERDRVKNRQGLYGNVHSSMAGDDFYYAKFASSRFGPRQKKAKSGTAAYLQPGARDEGAKTAKANMRYN